MPTPGTKGFRITGGRGFQMKFPNGYTVSVQFGMNNYCENRSGGVAPEEFKMVHEGDFHANMGDLLAGSRGCDDAETAVIDPNGSFVPYDRDEGLVNMAERDTVAYDVQARMSVMDVLTLLVKVASLPLQLPAPKPEVEEVDGELC